MATPVKTSSSNRNPPPAPDRRNDNNAKEMADLIDGLSKKKQNGIIKDFQEKLINGKTLKTSKYFKALLEAIRSSPFYVEDVDKACVLVPNIDHTLVNSEMDAPFRIARALRNLKYWNGGLNHLLFNFITCN